MRRSNDHRAGGGTLAVVVAAVALWGSLGLPVHADDEPVAAPPLSTGEVDGAVVAVGPPPVPPTTVVVAVGPPPVPPTTVVVAVGPPPVPPTSVDAAPVQTAAPTAHSGRTSDQPQSVLGVRRVVEGTDGVAEAIADMVATVESAVALIDRHL
jgi:hypothetical protein